MDAPALLPALVDALPVGVVVLDPDTRVVHFNRYEETLSGRRREQVVGRPFFERVAPCMDVKELSGWFRQNVGRRRLERDFEFEFDFPHLDRVRAVRVRLRDLEVGGRPFGALIIEDRSDELALQEMRERLSSLVVHDLKNPLSALTLLFGMIREDADDPAAVDELALEGTAAARRMSAMLLDLLEMSRLRSAQLPLARSPVDVGALVRSVVQEARPRVPQLRLEADVRWDGEPPLLDARLTRRLLDNLVANAGRFATGAIVVGVRAEADDVLFTVDDDGPGVPPEKRAGLFEPFQQLQARSDSNQGLGLSLVQVVAETHGGAVSIAEAPLGGARFAVRLPAEGPRKHQTERLRYRV